MKVKDLINRLNEYYSPDDQLIVAYWDKDGVQGSANVILTDDQWTDIIAEQEAYESVDLDRYGETLQDIALEVGQPTEEEEEEEGDV
jgi:hypothetical protein